MNWIKAKILLLLLLLEIVLTWLFLIVVMSPLQIPCTLITIFTGRLKRYTWGLWIGQDQLVNAILKGNPDITISSRVGYMSLNGSKTARSMEIVIDWLFYKIAKQQNHCFVSIEKDEEHC